MKSNKGIMNPALNNTIYHFIHEDLGEEFSTKHDMEIKYGCRNSPLSRVIRGEQESCLGWEFVKDTGLKLDTDSVKCISNYQEVANKFASYEKSEFPLYGLVSEVGELIDNVAKNRRTGEEIDPYCMMSEIGDVMWNLAMICEEFGLDLGEVAARNEVKLNIRLMQETIHDKEDRTI